MSDPQKLDEEQIQRLRNDILDTLDEELEMSIDEEGNSSDRATYFRELLRLQGELVKLQDWVVATKQKVVILFEGRDAAGKGGVIKRITQRLNPRVCH
jgi:polyphosphate kinase 2 (PPK2 family)